MLAVCSFIAKRVLYTWFSSIAWLIERLLYSTHQRNTKCFIANVISHAKCFDIDLARPSDFLYNPLSVSCEDSSALLGEQWTLYCMDIDFVYFAKGKSIIDLQVRQHPFMFPAQYHAAAQVARLTWSAFLDLCEQDIGPPRCRNVFVHNVPRAGTTLFSAIMQVQRVQVVPALARVSAIPLCTSFRTVSISEPDFIAWLSAFKINQWLPRSTIVRYTRSCYCYFSRHLSADQTLIIKPRHDGSWISAEIASALPATKFIYLTRRNAVKLLASIERMLNTESADMLWFLKLLGSPHLRFISSYLIGFHLVPNEFRESAPHVIEQVRGFKDKSLMNIDQAFIFLIESIVSHKRAKDGGLRFYDVSYEDMIGPSEATVTALYEYCGIPKSFVPEGLTALQTDSQKGTSLDKSIQQQVKHTELTAAAARVFNDVCREYGIPEQFSS